MAELCDGDAIMRRFNGGRGYVLVVVLLVSAALSLMVLASMRSALLQQKISVNFSGKLLASETHYRH